MRTIALVFVATMIGSMIAELLASARPDGGRGVNVGKSPGFSGARSFGGPANGHPDWKGSNPPGFSMGNKSGWDDGTLPGWRKDRKKGCPDRSRRDYIVAGARSVNVPGFKPGPSQ